MRSHKHIPVIGVVGGIGAGKSFFAQTLAKRKNVVIVEGDSVGHLILDRPEIQRKIRARFGDEVFAPDGSILRRVLGTRVFGNSPEHHQAKADLESIVHPPLVAELQRQIRQIRSAGRADAIILDAAILLEAGWASVCDAVVMIDSPPEVRLHRVMTTRGWSESEFRSREANQISVEEKRAIADYVVDNAGPKELVEERIINVLDHIMNGTPKE